MNTLRKIYTLIVVIVAISLSSCGGSMESAGTTTKRVDPLSCVVVLPAQVPYEESATKMGEMSDELHAGLSFLDATIPQVLAQSKVSRVIETSQIRFSMDDFSGGQKSVMDEIVKQSDCSTILVTTLSKFRQRQGGEYAVNEPASAAFELKLVDAETGRTLWMSTFSETQSSLMENLFSFGKAQSRGFKWITVENLAEQGLREMLVQCPYLF